MSPQHDLPSAPTPRSRHLSGIVEKASPDSRNSRAKRWLHAADLALATRRPQAAAHAYGEAAALLVDADERYVAEIHARRGHALRLAGHEDAEGSYEAALARQPDHAGALRGLIAFLIDVDDRSGIATLEEQLFNAIDDPAHRCVELIASGDRWARAGARTLARIRYRRALHLRPDSAAARRRSAG